MKNKEIKEIFDEKYEFSIEAEEIQQIIGKFKPKVKIESQMLQKGDT
ncbi:MAG: hypothetical protein V3R54_04685 [Thermodesulfovibrionia bacterium]